MSLNIKAFNKGFKARCSMQRKSMNPFEGTLKMWWDNGYMTAHRISMKSFNERALEIMSLVFGKHDCYVAGR